MKLFEYMASEKLSDDGFAEVIGRSRTTVSRIRRGLVRPDWATMTLIRDATGGAVEPNDFIASEPSEAQS